MITVYTVLISNCWTHEPTNLDYSSGYFHQNLVVCKGQNKHIFVFKPLLDMNGTDSSSQDITVVIGTLDECVHTNFDVLSFWKRSIFEDHMML